MWIFENSCGRYALAHKGSESLAAPELSQSEYNLGVWRLTFSGYETAGKAERKQWARSVEQRKREISHDHGELQH